MVQTDTLITGGLHQLSQTVCDQLRKTLLPLHVLNRFNPEPVDLVTFKTRFYDRYGEQEVPLLLALDGDTGVGYGAATESLAPNDDGQLVGELSPTTSAEAQSFPGDELHDLRLRLYTRFLIDGPEPAVITDQDLALLGKGEVPLPPSYYAFGSLLAISASAIDRGGFQFVLKALSGSSGFSLMGRFCAIDEQLARLVTEQMARQQALQPEKIYAEIAHLPQARTGNVVRRPHLRPYEIPYLTHSELPPDQQIHLDDLLVSVPNGRRVVIRSKRLGKEVVPQLTAAHDYRSGLPIYRFLCALQAPDAPFAVQWHWGAFEQARRLPRVQYRNIILKEASWLFDFADLSPSLSAEQNISLLRAQEQLPRLIALQQGDQELFLDLDSAVCCQLFVSTLRRIKTVRVIEWLQTPDQCPVEGPNGKLTHELVIPFTNPNEQPLPPLPVRPPVVRQRDFPPGGEWFYVKVYCGLSSVPSILPELQDLATEAVSRDGAAIGWFFLRFSDPEPHIRLRIHLKTPDQYAHLLRECHDRLNPFLLSGEVHSIQMDTYQRELERYGQEIIEETELIFWRDSEMVSKLLAWQPDGPATLLFACRSVDAYLTGFGLPLPEKIRLCETAY